jgi:hypothetical protein
MGSAPSPSPAEQHGHHHPVFRVVWFATNILFLLSIFLAVHSLFREYSTRRYLKGFSDAVIPESSTPQEKVDAILNWMANGPARQRGRPALLMQDRDPTDTLNYASLLQVCGSATNAFINLADSAGMLSRRLLLLDSRRMTMHVVAEVLIDGRWIVVDPAFRVMPRGADGQPLTREQLADPAVFAEATRDIPKYSPEYTYDRTAHVRLSRVPILGRFLRRNLDRFLPGWEDSAALSLLFERESLAIAVFALLLVVAFALLRVALRWYGERRLALRSARVREQFARAYHAFLDTTG